MLIVTATALRMGVASELSQLIDEARAEDRELRPDQDDDDTKND